MKKYIKLMVLGLLVFLTSLSVNAKKMNIDELGQEALTLKPSAQYVYVIGSYAFTSEYILKTEDIMLAAKSIDAPEVLPDGTPNLEAMNVQKIVPILNNFELTGKWEVSDNLVGNEKLDPSKELNIYFIDGKYYGETSEANLTSEIGSDYTEALNNYNFTSNSAHSENFKIENNEVTGLLYKTEIDDSVFSGDDKTGYYFAYVIEVPDATNNTKVTIEGYKNTTNATIANFDVKPNEEGKTPGLLVLFAVSPETPINERKIVITVDIDGDALEYGKTEYTLDYSKLDFQVDSEVSTQIAGINKGGYLSSLNQNLKIDNKDLTGTLNDGVLVEQTLTDSALFSGKDRNGYYFDLKFNLPSNIDTSKVVIKEVTAKDGNTDKSGSTEFDKDTMTALYRFDTSHPTCEEASNCKIYYKVDLDGDENKYLPVVYELDYSKIKFEKMSIFTVKSLDGDYDSQNWNGWTKEAGYLTDFSIDPSDARKVSVSGLLPRVASSKFTGGDLSTNFKNAVFFLGIEINTELGSASGSEVKFIDTSNNSVTINKDDFNASKKLYILKALNTSTKTFTITLDWDDSGEEYAPYTITINWEKLNLQKASDTSTVNVIKSDSELHETDKQDLKNFGFDFINDITYTNKELTGTVKEQTLESAAGYDELEGYYVPLKIEVPEAQKANRKWTVKLYSSDGTSKEVTPKGYEYDQGYMIVLFKLNREAADKKIKYAIDYDGSENNYLYSEFTVSYSKLNFKYASDITFKYQDKNGSNSIVKTVYEGDKIAESLAPVLTPKDDYHEFAYWYKDNKDEAFTFGNTLSENLNFTLNARWAIDADSYIDSKIKTENVTSKDKLSISRSANDITITNLAYETKVSDLNAVLSRVIEEALAGNEIKSFKIEGNSYSKDFSTDASTEFKELFKNVMSLNSDDDYNSALLNNLVKLKKDITITIESLDDSVKLKNTTNTYTIKFATDIVTIESEEELEAALNAKNPKIYITKEFDVKKQHEINYKVTIDGQGKALTATSDAINSSIFKVTYQGVVINNLKLTDANEGIIVTGIGSLTSDKLNVTGCIKAGVELEDGASYTATNMTYKNEKYDNPAVKVPRDNIRTTVNLTRADNSKAPATTVQEIITYDKRLEQNPNVFNNANPIGDLKQDKADYNYKHYYLSADVANRWIKMSYTADRGITGSPKTYILYYDKESSGDFAPEPAKDIEGLTKHSDNNVTYEIAYWRFDYETKHATGSVPIPTSDISYGAEYKVTYKDHVTEVSNEGALKSAIQNPKYTTIIVTGNIVLQDELVIERTDLSKEKKLVITGVKNGSTDIVGSIQGKIKVNSSYVIFEEINIIGAPVKGVIGDVVTIASGVTDFRASESKFSIESGTWNSILHYEGETTTTTIFYNEFEGSDVKNFIEFDKISGTTLNFSGNDFIDNNNPIAYFKFKEIAASTSIRIGEATLINQNSESYLIKTKAMPEGSNITFDLANIWTSKSSVKDAKVQIDTTSNQDASGLKFKVYSSFKDKLNVTYTDGSSKEVVIEEKQS